MGGFVRGPGGAFQSKTPVEESLIFGGKKAYLLVVVRSADKGLIKSRQWRPPWLVSPNLYWKSVLSRLLKVHRLCL